MKSVNRYRFAGVLVVLALMAAPVAAQEFGEVAEEFRRSFDALRGYTWTARVEYSRDGKLRSTEIYRVSVDRDGKFRRELVSSEGKRSKQTDVADSTLRNIRDMIDAYTHMNPDNFAAAFAENPRSVVEGKRGEPTRVISHGVLSRDDKMEIWVDPLDYRLLRLQLEGTMAKEHIRLDAEFDRFEDVGPTYVKHSKFFTTHKKKSVVIETHNSDLAPTGR
jgi:outer membrane lipoprotein-sorting protein